MTKGVVVRKEDVTGKDTEDIAEEFSAENIEWINMNKDKKDNAFLSIGYGGNFYLNVDAMDIIKEKINDGKLQWLRIGVNRTNKLLFLKPVPHPEERCLCVDEDSTDTPALTFNSAGLMKEIEYMMPRSIGKTRFNAFCFFVNYSLVVDISEAMDKDSFLSSAV